jgi:FG-GAP-like repeat
LVSANPGIFLSMGRQGFELDQEFIVEGYYPLVISGAVADFNGDGLMDIAIGVNSPEDVLIFTNDGTGKYQLTSYATGIGASQLLGVDLTNAGKPDVVGNAGNIVTVLLHK